jgi:hypothetical protein
MHEARKKRVEELMAKREGTFHPKDNKAVKTRNIFLETSNM